MLIVLTARPLCVPAVAVDILGAVSLAPCRARVCLLTYCKAGRDYLVCSFIVRLRDVTR